MYAIPAETASQGQPFQKENLPGPGQSYPNHRLLAYAITGLFQVVYAPSWLVWDAVVAFVG